MTRFDASEPTERRTLFADAVTAHRERASPFLTAEVTADDDGAEFGAGGTEAATGTDDGESDDGEGGDEADEPDRAPPWIQFGDTEFNLDCTDAELERLESLLDEFPEFRIDQLETPDEAEATNVRITARSDANRLAAFADRAFTDVYDQPDDYRLWIAAV